MDGLAAMSFIFGMVGVVAFVRLQKLTKTLKEKDPNKLIPPLHGALLKNEQDVQLLERLAFMSRRDQSK